MDFIFKINHKDIRNLNLVENQKHEIDLLKFTPNKAAYKVHKYEFGEISFTIIGDLIFPESITCQNDEKAKFLFEHYSDKSFYEIKGFYYVIIQNSQNNSIEFHSCFLSILPVYYVNSDRYCIVSGSLDSILSNMETEVVPNESYVVEKAMFNYSFLKSTPYRDVFLMPSASYIIVSGDGLNIHKAYSIENFFIESPKPWKKNLEELSGIYCEEIPKYFPKQSFAITLTGGFDGRTVLSAALHAQKTFSAFSYGSADDSDVTIPQSIGLKYGFNYIPFLLDEDYAERLFWHYGLRFLLKSDGAGNIGRGHYVMTAENLSKSFEYLLTGNFGSELIRSLKDPGLMASESLFALFDFDSKNDYEKFILNKGYLKFIDKNILKNNLPAIIDEVWDFKMQLPQGLSKNQKFYIYVFGEVFRKYFGPEIVVQSDYIINRSPFIDFNIFKTTLESSIAGPYQNFREKNPIKRFHGQVLYSYILKSLYPPLLNIYLDRNYKPRDFLTKLGRLSIIMGYVNRNYFHVRNKYVPSYSQKLYEFNSIEILKTIENSKCLDKKVMKNIFSSGEWKTNIHEFVNTLSLELFYQKNQKG